MTIEKLNPASAKAPDGQRKRIPMSVPVQKLEAPEIPGYHLHWFRGEPARIQRALDGGYEFVDETETQVNAVGLGNESTRSGNTDLGSRVSVASGGAPGRDGQPERLILMKIKQEWYEQDQQKVADRNQQVANAITGGLVGSEKDSAADARMRYLSKDRTSIPDLFNPHKKARPQAGR